MDARGHRTRPSSRLPYAAALAYALALVGCAAATPIAPVRFNNAGPIWRVNDRLPLTKAPEVRRHALLLDHLDAVIFRRVTYHLEVPRTRRARATNSLDEVPDSTWFRHRMGRGLAPEALLRGPAEGAPPDQRLPLTIHSTKVGGFSVGFIVSDTSGRRYLLKFDVKGFPEVETGAHVVAQRLLWACGYHVPDDNIVYLRRSDLRLAKGATIKDGLGNKKPMTPADMDLALSKIEVDGKGRIRGLASAFLRGKLLGGWPMEGVRKDDRNDRVPHQLRRDVRGMRLIFAWLNHTDVKEDNTLDILVSDPQKPEHRYVRHYLVDFGKALGVMNLQDWRQTGFARQEDVFWALPSLIRLGTLLRPWEDQPRYGVRGLGVYSARHYDPDRWTTAKDYWPFYEADRFDDFWAAKIIARFRREHLRAAIKAARYSKPAAARILEEVLWRRARMSVAPAFRRVAPLDAFAVRGDTLCFDDLAERYGYVQKGEVSTYRARAFADDSSALGTLTMKKPDAPSAGRRCVGTLPASSSPQGYLIVQLRVGRGRSEALPAVDVHLARGPRGRYRVIGLWRH